MAESSEPDAEMERKTLNFSSPTSFVTIQVDKGEPMQTFVIHKNAICHYSEYFSTAFNSSLKEGNTQSLILNDVDASLFGLLVNWVYTQTIEKVDNGDVRPQELLELYIVADRFLVEDLAKQTLSKIMDMPCNPANLLWAKWGGKEGFIDFQRHAYASGLQPLKDLAVEKTIAIVSSGDMKDMTTLIPQDMAYDFMSEITRRYKDLKYHIHRAWVRQEQDRGGHRQTTGWSQQQEDYVYIPPAYDAWGY